MELYEPVEIGPLVVAQLSFTLPGLKFPLDLAGGVPSFRHRRGDLEHVRVELSLDRLGRWLHSRVGDVLGPLSSPPRAWGAPDGIAIGIYHPGWVVTDMGGSSADIDIATSAKGLAARFDALTLATTGCFEDYAGRAIPF